MIPKRCFHTTTRNHKLVRLHWWPYFKRWQDLDRDLKKEENEDAAIKSYFRPTDDMYIRPEKREDG